MKTTVAEAVNACYYLLAETGDEAFKAARSLINPGLAAIEIRCRLWVPEILPAQFRKFCPFELIPLR